MQIFTAAEIIKQKNLANKPVLDYREENGKALIEVQLRAARSTPKESAYDPEKYLAILRSMQFSVGHPTNVTKDIRRERNSSPSIRRPRTKTKKR